MGQGKIRGISNQCMERDGSPTFPVVPEVHGSRRKNPRRGPPPLFFPTLNYIIRLLKEMVEF